MILIILLIVVIIAILTGLVFYIIKKSSFLIGLSAIIIILLVFITLFFLLSKSPNFWYFYHVLFKKPDLTDPVVLEEFNFLQLNFSKIFVFKPKYKGAYEINLIDKTGNIKKTTKFLGKLKIEIKSLEKVLDTKIINGFTIGQYRTDTEQYISGYISDISYPDKGLDDIRIKITVLEVDEKFLNFNISPMICIKYHSL